MGHLAINNLDQLDGEQGVHAFIVGISDYSHLPGKDEPANPATFNLQKLSSPATSAYSFFEWLTGSEVSLSRSLATCHLLLAPSPEELQKIPAMGQFTDATISEFALELGVWRRLCGQNPDSQALFYFCGHGVQPHDKDAVLLLQDFGAPGLPLQQSVVRVSNIFQGMAPHVIEGVADMDFSKIAREQLYFIDACREKPDELAGVRAFPGVPVFDEPLSGQDMRDAPIFFSTVPGERAFGNVGQISVFTGALLEALEIACDGEEEDEHGNPLWPVRARFLHDVLKHVIGRNVGTKQRLGNLQGLVGDPVLHYLPGPPEFETRLSITPENASAATRLQVQSVLDDQQLWSTESDPRPDHPYTVNVRLGVYEIAAEHPDFGASTLLWLPRADQRGSEKLVRLRTPPDVR